jgi:outer membrane PBP1 activator LpoA protein
MKDIVCSQRFVQAPTLHVFGPGVWHDASFIVGNTEGLTRLRNMINMALSSASASASGSEGIAVTGDIMVNDGEYFDLIVYCTGPAFPPNGSTPYTEDIAKHGNQDSISPWETRYYIEKEGQHAANIARDKQ